MPEPIDLADLIAHCGGDPATAVEHIASVIPAMPDQPMPYASLAALRTAYPGEFATGIAGGNWTGLVAARAFVAHLDGRDDEATAMTGSLIAYDPAVDWSAAPWFGTGRHLARLTGDGLSTAVMRINGEHGDLTDPAHGGWLGRWFALIEVVSERSGPEQLARMAILCRNAGRYADAMALCERADAVERVMFTETVRAGTYRRMGDDRGWVAALQRAADLAPGDWSPCLDLADAHAMLGDYPSAAALAARSAGYEPHEITARVAAAAYRARVTGSADDLQAVRDLLPHLPASLYKDSLIEAAGLR
jgi:hypothetical protein